ncbi:hypothetical protein [uncultured Phycicoccus sp.]|uniref:hypothetical protein n=1 Tax=uncultured Phycicoccus sp. TaxID=661422 RepID=UPI002609FA09|nr:hypothetical protein [uncultured Phycicoccus sp.]
MMSVDDRLRAALTAYAACLPEPEVELRFHRVLALHRRRRALRLVSAAAGLVAACAVVSISLGWPARPAALWPSGDITPTSRVEGAYAGLARALPDIPRSAGRWGLDFGEDGRMTASAPTGSGRSPEPAGWLRGDAVTTELFAEDACRDTAPGTYTVARLADRVVLEVAEDRCAARMSLLTATTWVSTLATSWNGPRIPDSRWVRDIDVAELRKQGYTLTPDALRANFLDDGHGRFHLEFTGTKFYVFVEDEDGSLVLGDQGDVSYDALGRWVQNLSLAVEWRLDGDALVTENVDPVHGVRLNPATAEERFALEGTWHRAG